MVTEVKAKVDDKADDVKFDLDESTKNILMRSKRTIEDVVEVGRELKLVKGHLEHGQWEKWVIEDLRWHPATAWRYMKAATRYENLVSTQDLDEQAFSQELWGNIAKEKQTESQEDLPERFERYLDTFDKKLSHFLSQIGSHGNLSSTTREKLRNLAQTIADMVEGSEPEGNSEPS